MGRLILGLILVVPLACVGRAAPDGHATSVLARLAKIEQIGELSVFATSEQRLVPLTLTNKGALSWSSGGKSAVLLGYRWRGQSVVEGERTPLPVDVKPGEAVDVVVVVRAPKAAGEYELEWDLVEEGAGWFGASGGALTVQVQVREPETRAAWLDVKVARPMYADVVGAVNVKVRNTGTVMWTPTGDQAVLLSYHWRDAGGAVVRWDGARTKIDRPVPPGDTLDTQMRVEGPLAAGRYLLEVDLLREGVAWFGSTTRVPVDVGAASYSYVLELVTAPARVTLGQPVPIKVRAKNSGNAPWPNAGARQLRLSYHLRSDDGQLDLWDGARTQIGNAVGPGEIVEIEAVVRAPERPGRFTFLFDMVQENVMWLGIRNGSLPVKLEVAHLDFAARFSPLRTVKTMAIGARYRANVDVRNAGQLAWPRGGFRPVHVSYHWFNEAGARVVWDGPRFDLPKDVAPGESVSLAIEVTPPDRPGTYTLALDLVQEGVAWFTSKGADPARERIVVARPSFEATLEAVAVPPTMKAGAIERARITVRNDGKLPWSAAGEHPVHIAHHWRDESGVLLVWDGFRTRFERDVQPGETVALEAWIFVPATPGRYVLEIDVVQEGITWFGDKGTKTLRRTVDAIP